VSIARRHYSPDEKRQIVALAIEGYTYKQIAEKLRPGVKTAWRSIGEIVRTERENMRPPSSQPYEDAARNSTLSKQVYDFGAISPASIPITQVELPEEVADSLTAREIMGMLDDEQRELWVATYEDLRNDADDDSVTRAENEMLMRAALAQVQYFRASKMYHTCEGYLLADVRGELGEDKADPRKRMAGRSEVYKKEMQDKHKELMDLLDGLKLKRSQRLKEIKDTRNTFLDLQTELTQRERRESIVDDIKKINMATREEFLRMSRGEVGPDGKQHSWLIGAFDHLFPDESDTKTEEER